METNQIVIPEGWTFFAHRTNTDRWSEEPFDKQSIEVKKLMSVITESDIHQEIKDYGREHMQGFSGGNGTPFEIRCLICSLQHIKALDHPSDVEKSMLNEFYFDKHNIGGAGGQRHHSIPKGEELVVLGTSQFDEIYQKEKKVIWTIPKRFLDLYNRDINRGKNRIVEIKENKHMQEKQDKKDATVKKDLRSSLEDYCEGLDYDLKDAIVLNRKFGTKEKYQIVFLKVKDQMDTDIDSKDTTSLVACRIDEQGNVSDIPGLNWNYENEYNKTIMDKSTSSITPDGRMTGVPFHVEGHCEFANGLELSIASGRNGKMQIFECGKGELLGKKVGCKTIDEIDNDIEKGR